MSAKSSKNSKKQELIEKVQEIQKRQKNWLKQREEQKKTDISGTYKADTKKFTASTTNTGEKTSASSNHGSRNSYNADYAVEKMSSKFSKDKFQSWMEARDKADKLQLQENNDTNKEPDVLKISSSRTSGYATPDPEWHPLDHHSNHDSHLGSNDHTLEAAAKSLMSHQDFDEIANKIVARVKNELDIPYKTSSKTDSTYKGYTKEASIAPRELESRERTNFSRGREPDELISSHYCPECRELMLSTDHVPMILTPCAHSMCQSCCQGRSLCPQCACSISSKTCNIMLLQIIQNHHKSRERTADTRKQTYSPDNYREKAKTRQQYHEEYENLQTRQEVLQIESKEIQCHMAKLANRIAQQQQQIQNIKGEEKRVKDKIQTLKERLVELETHRREYDRTIDGIEMERTKDKNKLNMVQDTLASIEVEMEKLRVLTDGR